MSLYFTRFFTKILKLAFIYKKYDTLRYVTFLYTKSQSFRKSKTICVTFLYTKIRTLCATRFFIEFLKLAEWGGHFYVQETIHFALHFYIKKSCTLRYVFISKIYLIVLIPNLKRTYDQSD